MISQFVVQKIFAWSPPDVNSPEIGETGLPAVVRGLRPRGPLWRRRARRERGQRGRRRRRRRDRHRRGLPIRHHGVVRLLRSTGLVVQVVRVLPNDKAMSSAS